VIESFGAPTAMTSDAVSVKFAYFAPGEVTGTTFKLLVESIQGPPGSSMIEARRLTLTVTDGASFHGVTRDTRFVMFLWSFSYRLRFLPHLMTAAAALLLMAINALQVKQFHMVFVVEGHHRTFLVVDPVYSFVRHSDVWMFYPYNIGGVNLPNS